MSFKVPLVPYVPALSIFCNIELMVHLSALTWIRFFIWMIVGLLMYFCYGIHHSREGTLGTSYSMLISSGGRGGSQGSGGAKGSSGGWGASATARIGRIFDRANVRKNEDKTAIIIDEDES